jgi:phage minor structural protein
MIAGDEWALWSKVIGPGTLNFTLGEYKYSSVIDGYDDVSGEISFSDTTKTETKGDKTYSIYTVESSSSSKESFKKKSNVRLQISTSDPGEYYLEAIELFKVARCDNTIIPLEEQADSLEDRAIEKTYYYFTDDALDGITNEEQLIPEETAKTLSYTTYKPVYNEGAQKVRTVTAKESNYFNILQSIAETFEAWLTFDITRVNGGITSKKIAFKNYVGGDNYACFRYGVNLKDIQRTFESKNIVTKLIVKNNSNEHADSGFCTIQRASANPTGENYIYDFQYFFNQRLMNDREYLDTLYALDKTIDGVTEYAYGEDYEIWNGEVLSTENNPLNLQGYFPRIKTLNNKIQTESELLANIAQDLTKYKADLAVAEAGLDAATSGIEEVREDFLLLTGAPIDMLSVDYVTAVDKI